MRLSFFLLPFDNIDSHNGSVDSMQSAVVSFC